MKNADDLDAVFAGLGPSSSTDQRWTALASFVEGWYGKPVPPRSPRGAADGPPPLLAEFVRLLRAVPEAVSHNDFYPPEKEVLKEGKLLFLSENQGVWLWSTEPRGSDPRVWCRLNEDGEPWVEEPEPLSGFLIQEVLFEAISCGDALGAGVAALDRAEAEAILSRLEPLPLRPWVWGGVRFHARGGVWAMTMENMGGLDLYLAARSAEVLEPFRALVDGWDHVGF